MSLLPGKILPEGESFGTVAADGTVRIDHEWWLFLYNLAAYVLGTGGVTTFQNPITGQTTIANVGPPGVMPLTQLNPVFARTMGVPGMDGEDGLDAPIIPGPTGMAGGQGAPGATVFFDAADGEDSNVPGPIGIQGLRGLQGFTGNPGFDGDPGEDGMPIRGETGSIGLRGLPGPAVFIDADAGDDGMPIPGQAGAQGLTGAAGVTVFMDPEQGEQGMPIPGQNGAAGTPGAAGAPGSIIFMDPDQGDDGMPIPSGPIYASAASEDYAYFLAG